MRTAEQGGFALDQPGLALAVLARGQGRARLGGRCGFMRLRVWRTRSEYAKCEWYQRETKEFPEIHFRVHGQLTNSSLHHPGSGCMQELKRRHEKSHAALAGRVALCEARIDYSTFISLSKLSA
jgi:hypothetical protein